MKYGFSVYRTACTCPMCQVMKNGRHYVGHAQTRPEAEEMAARSHPAKIVELGAPLEIIFEETGSPFVLASSYTKKGAR